MKKRIFTVAIKREIILLGLNSTETFLRYTILSGFWQQSYSYVLKNTIYFLREIVEKACEYEKYRERHKFVKT